MRRLLLVEDNLINQTVAIELLEELPIDVVVAGDGREAVERFSVDRFDIVVMDVQMPVMDGLTATREIRALESRRGSAARVPILGVTANVMPGDRTACIEAGMDDFLGKPFDPDEFLRRIATLSGLDWPAGRN